MLAGVTATVGIATVAAASSATMLALGLLIAGSSTGIASPPMAAAIARAVSDSRADQAQTIVNAGTGVGVIVSGPIAFALLGNWRLAWSIFALVSAVVTVAVWRFVPDGRPTRHRREVRPDRAGSLPPGTLRLLVCSGLMGLASIGVWTLGRQTIIDRGGTSLLVAIVWTVIGIAGIAGALAGPAVNRLGLTRSWITAMASMAVAEVLFALLATQPVVAATAAAAFGAAYIALTGILLVWAIRLFPDRASFGVGISFLLIAVGQAVGAPLAGAGVDPLTLPGVFIACAVVAGAAALLAPRRV